MRIAARSRMRRSDEEKRALVNQILQSGNQSAAMKELRIYPNQFYAWKKLLVDGGPGASRRSRPASDDLLEEARRYLSRKSSLLERLRSQRDELDGMIAQLEAD